MDKSKYAPLHGSAASFMAILASVFMIRSISKIRRLETRKHGGSRIDKQSNRQIGREETAAHLSEGFFLSLNDINSITSKLGRTFSELEFERMFRMPRQVSERIRDKVVEVDPFFRERKNCTGKKSCSTE